MTYIISIKYAFLIFPLITLLITFPYMIIQYHKYGSISFYKTILIYLFILYLITAYFLVILPLPKIEEVALLNTPRLQLIPFKFIYDFIRETPFIITNISTYKSFILHSSFYVPIFNIFLTIPYGMYLRYFKKLSIKKILKYSLLLSLFFEFTQLTGLYFIYPRSYRLCDIDDIILNTCGGLLGALVIMPLVKYLPDIKNINQESLIKGEKVSGIKRLTSFIFDIIIYLVIDFILFIITKRLELSSQILFIIYYLIIPIIFKGSTLGQLFLHLKEVSISSKYFINILLIILRKVLFIVLYLVLPISIIYIWVYIFNDIINEIGLYILLGLFLTFYLIIIIKYVFTSKDMLYEKISRTKLISIIKK